MLNIRLFKEEPSTQVLKSCGSPFVGYWEEGQKIYWNYVVSPTVGNVGDVVVYTSGVFKAFDVEDYVSTPSLGVPVGLVLIPASHDVYGNGDICILSLTDANNGNYCKWSPGGVQDNLSLTYYTTYPALAGGTLTQGYLPKENGTYWSTSKALQSPYAEDGGVNEASRVGAMSDFAGKSNTETIVNFYTNPSEDYAAELCKTYRVEGVDLDFYLGSIGEMSYIYPRMTILNNSLTLLRSLGTNLATKLSDNSFWSSTENTKALNNILNLATGYLRNYDKSNAGYLRPLATCHLTV